jgi:hypothetical protein
MRPNHQSDAELYLGAFGRTPIGGGQRHPPCLCNAHGDKTFDSANSLLELEVFRKRATFCPRRDSRLAGRVVFVTWRRGDPSSAQAFSR